MIAPEDWSDEAVEAALNCLYSPKSVRWQKQFRQDLRHALSAALSIERNIRETGTIKNTKKSTLDTKSE